jgi:pimeloyl-ACP methyl ester carboxylesterase
VTPPPDRSGAGVGGVRLISRRSAVPWQGRTLSLHHVATVPAPRPHLPGSDSPLVLVHGMASSWRQWRNQMLRLGDRVPLVAVDLPGFGGSGQSHRPLAADDYAALLEAWARAQGWERLVAVGHSFGGAVLVDWAGRWPERFVRLGLLAPAAIYHEWFTAGGGPIRWPVVGPLLRKPFVWLASTRWYGPKVFGHIVTRLQDVRPDEVVDLQWGCRRAREMLRALDYYRFPQLPQRLEAIRAPTILGWGTADRVVPFADAPFYTARIAHCELRAWEGCGHVPMMERREECDRLLLDVALGPDAEGQVPA